MSIKSKSSKPGGWLRKLAWLAGLLVLLLVVFYFVATSSAVFKNVILPKVSKALGADVTVGEAQISPFSRVLLRDLKVQPPGGEPLLTVQEIHANYNLWSILGGHLVVTEVAIESPVVTVVENTDGTCNLDVFTKAAAKETKPAPPTTSPSSKSGQIDIGKATLNNATVRLAKKYADGRQDLTEVTSLNFTVSHLKNGQSGKIELAAVVAVQQAAQTNAAAASLSARLQGGFDIALTPDLKPASIKGSTSLTVVQATSRLADLNTVAAQLECDLNATELKELALRLTKAGTSLAEIRMHGPLDLTRTEGQLELEIVGIDKQALNLAGASSGLDFGTTTFNSTNHLAIAKGGKLISLSGRFDLARLQVKQNNQTSPRLDLHSDYEVTVDQSASYAVLRTLNLIGTQDSRPLLRAGLSSPLTLGWGNASSAAGDASLDLSLTNLNLADWKAFAGEAIPAGIARLTLKLVSQKGGNQMAFDLDTHLNDLSMGTGSANGSPSDVHIRAAGSLTDLKRIKLDDYQLEVFRERQSAVTLSGSGTFDRMTQDADLQVVLKAALAPLLAVPGASATNCAVDFKGHVTHQQRKITLKGELALTPTARATNRLHFNESLDFAHSDAITGSFQLAAEALDVTSYYDLLSLHQPAATKNPGVAPKASSPSKPDREPDAMTLPLKNCTFDLNIGHLFLRELDISNWRTTALIDGGHIVLKPCQLALNGATINATADLNLGVPGYKYDVSFNAAAIPLAPLVNSFAPDRKGQLAGTTSLDVQLKGAGITGPSLQRNLGGQFNFGATNLNLSIANVRSPILNSLIDVIVGIPDLIRNPASKLGSLFAGPTGGGARKGGFADDLTATPIEVISLNAKAGDGSVDLQQSEVRSQAFQALATGKVTLAGVLTNSAIQIPVRILLARALADRIGLVGAATPTNVTYIALPDFLTMRGTLGEPKTDVNGLALLGLAVKAGAGIGKQIGAATGGKAGSLINSVGDLLGGHSAPPTGSASNAPTTVTNASPGSGLLNLLKKPK